MCVYGTLEDPSHPKAIGMFYSHDFFLLQQLLVVTYHLENELYENATFYILSCFTLLLRGSSSHTTMYDGEGVVEIISRSSQTTMYDGEGGVEIISPSSIPASLQEGGLHQHSTSGN